MGTRLVTIATFDQAAQARMAKNVLDEAGIRVAVSDETLVAMDWLLSNAVGGIKVQVWEEDADRAVELLEQKLGSGAEPEADITPEELAAQAEAAARESEVAQKPQQLRYLGYLGSKSSGLMAAFMKGEEAVTLHVGDMANPRWKLVQFSEKSAVFQNIKYADLRHTLEARDGGGAAGAFGQPAVSNEF